MRLTWSDKKKVSLLDRFQKIDIEDKRKAEEKKSPRRVRRPG